MGSNSTSYKLQSFSGASDHFEIEVRAAAVSEKFVFHFLLKSTAETLEAVIWPVSRATPVRKDGLWQTTVFELFLAEPGGDQYLEINASPSGDWNVYSFTSERHGMKEVSQIKESPIRRFSRSDRSAEMQIEIPCSMFAAGSIEFGATVIIDWGADKEYWALKHASDRPDFHKRASFIGRLEPRGF